MNTARECERIIRKKHLTVSAAESCTGGLLSSAFISIPGSSEWFFEGCVTYTIPAKITRLGVLRETIDKHTVVSAEVAAEMAKGIRRNLDTDIGIATTGYAGPGGGDEFNPVGTVFVCISLKGKGEYTKRLSLSGERNEIRQAAVEGALEFLIEVLGGN